MLAWKVPWFAKTNKCQYYAFYYKPDYISRRKHENCIKRQKKKNAKKIISEQGGIVFRNS